MSVGIVPTKDQIDNNGGSLLKNLDDALARCERLQTWLLATPDATLQAAPYSYSSQEVATLKSAFSDIAQLATIYRGTANLAVAKDFRQFAKLLWGFNL